MTLERMRLKDGVSPRDAARSIQERVRYTHNVASWGTHAPDRLVDQYLKWVEDVELVLSAFTHDPDILTMLYSDRYFYIRGARIDPRPWPLVEGEVKFQAGRLERLTQDLEERAERLSAAPGHLTILDTHVLLHYRPPGEIPWPELVRQPEIRLVVPLRVVEELDEKKWARGDKLADRARVVIRWLDRTLGRAGAPGRVSPLVTIEVPVDRGPRHRPADADEEILNTCDELRQMAGREVTLVTADQAMQIRGEGRDILVVRMPADRYTRTLSDGSSEPPSDQPAID